ncbi:MAG: TonB-dependent receptor [Pseudomonadota bacterium]
MTNHKNLASKLLSGVGLAAMASTGALAQDDEIIVSATKREQTLQEVPIAVSVVDADTINDAQIIDLIDLQASVPSLRVTQQQNASQTNFVIRGFGNGANNPGIEPAVGVFIDGVFRSRSAAALLDLPELERVEVLRGPQSTLFGKNVSVGAISITTSLPQFEWGGTAEATFGNLGTTRFRGTLTGPITDTLAFRVSGSTNNREGTYTNEFNGQNNLNERDRWAVRGQLLWEPTETLRFRAIADYNKIDEVCCGTVLIENGPVTAGVIGAGLGAAIPSSTNPGDRLTALDQEPPNELEGRGVSLQADWDLGFAVLTSITSMREQRDFNDTDVDFTAADLATQPQEVNYETFTQELRLAGDFETGIGNFNWLAGAFLFSEEVNFFQQTTFGTQFRDFGNILLGGLGTDFATVEGTSQLVAGLTQGPAALFPEFAAMPANGVVALPFGSSFADQTGFTGNYELDNRSTSLFFQTDWEVTDRLTLTGGVAYNRDRKKAVGNTIQTDPFQNIFFSQFFDPAAVGTGSGAALAAADGLGTAIGTPFNPADPTAFFVAAATAAATNPAFGVIRQGVVDGTTAALEANPALNPLAAFPALSALQFIPRQTPFPQPGAVRDDEISLSDDGFAVDDAINVTARIAYDVTDDLNVYFSYATGYKAPAVNLSQDAQVPQIGNNGLAVGRFAAAEDVTVFEIGFKARFDGGFLNVALFDQTVDNFQSNAFTGTGFVFANAGEQSVRGFEVEGLYSPFEAFALNFGLTYLDPNFDSFVAAPCPAAGLVPFTQADIVAQCAVAGVTTVDLSGEDPVGIHPVSLTAAATYEWDLGGGNTLTPRVEYLFESEVDLFQNQNELAPTRRVSQLNANMAFRMENGFSVNVWGRNLANDDGLITAFPSVAQAGSLNAYVVQPRTWGVSIRKDF